METYQNLKDRHKKEFNQIEIGGAFNNKQFKKMLIELGAKDKTEVVSLGSGAFIHKNDKKKFLNMMTRHLDEIQNRIKTGEKRAEFITQMFLAELFNHEYGYTRDTTDTLEYLGISEEDIQADPVLKQGLKTAIEIVEIRESIYN